MFVGENMSYEFVTEAGNRSVNEDCIKCSEKNGSFCFVVADGLGGHGKGEIASKIVAEEMIKCFEESETPELCIEQAFLSAQNVLLDEQLAQHAKFEMKTTAVMLVISSGGVARWGHIGDSRLYLFKKSKMKTRTIDHSVPQMLVLAKDIKERDIRFHPDRNKLLKVMGVPWGRRHLKCQSR